jgi:FtsP/CotA-like multicopper oxidase with cupredoxin domain
MMKIVIGDDAPDDSAPYWSPNWAGSRPQLRPQPPLDPTFLATLQEHHFRLRHGGGFENPEIQWTIRKDNGEDLPFNHEVPLHTVTRDQPELWTISTSGGWDHPMHFHQEEFRILSRSNGLNVDDNGKDDVVELIGGTEVRTYRNFRSFTGKYVAHCHQLAHEDHAMMFGWVIAPPPGEQGSG